MTLQTSAAGGRLSSAFGLVGESPAIAGLKAYLPKVAQSRATVLVTGETGTGKERVAQAIHALSPRCRAPFVVVNCGALPDTLIESELFGHARGAFTGAVSAQRGKLVEADGGTLFLDEIGEMSLYAQARLLRVLETQEIHPLGGGARQHVDIRVVAATNRELEGEVTAHLFRADLFYRLNVARLVIPPLRDRPGDVALLAGSVIAEFNARDDVHVEAPDSDLLSALMAHDWPGNVRELRNLIEAVFIDPPDGRVGLAHLPPAFQAVFGRYCRTTPETERSRLINGGVRFVGSEAGYTVPPEILARFIGNEKLYFGLATAGDGGPMKVAVIRVNAMNPEAEAKIAAEDRKARRTSDDAAETARATRMNEGLAPPGALPSSPPKAPDSTAKPPSPKPESPKTPSPSDKQADKPAPPASKEPAKTPPPKPTPVKTPPAKEAAKPPPAKDDLFKTPQ